MNHIVLDLEWNQAADEKIKEKTELLFEIIEIGAIKLNNEKRQIDTFHEMIRPQVFQKMNQITGELIHLKMEQLMNCRSFQEVISDFLRWCGEDAIFCTWGNLDLFELQRNLEYYKMSPLADGPIAFYDVQKLFSFAFEDKKKRRTLEYAIDYLHIEKDIPFHRADCDAYYTAKVFQKIKNGNVLSHYSYDIYHIPQTKADEVHAYFHDYEKYISRAFEDKAQAMADEDVNSMKCYLCGQDTKVLYDWFTMNNGKHYYGLFSCKRHGNLQGKIRMRKSVFQETYVVKTIKKVSKREIEELLSRKEQAKLIRREREKRIREKNKVK